MQKIIMSILSLSATILYGQVGIIAGTNVPPGNFPHSSSILDVESANKGFLAPRISLASVTSASPVSTPKTGLLVYNTTDNSELDKGYYYWNGAQWLPLSTSSNTILNFQASKISVSTLGYMPIGSGDTAPGDFIYGNIKGNKVGCFKFTTGENATSHSYCGYDLKNTSGTAIGVDWPTSFAISKSLNGYLATATSTEEWEFIKNNLLSSGLTSQNQMSIWLGFNKVTYPGNPLEFSWITGEKSMVAWERAGIAAPPYLANASFEFNFAANEPSNSGGTEGCVHILPGSSGVDRRWNDVNCNSTSAGGELAAYLIVEFQN